MINNDVLIRFARSRISSGHCLGDNWVDYARILRRQILDIESGFPGIGDNDLDLALTETVKPGAVVILSDTLDTLGQSDSAPVLGKILESSESPEKALLEIHGFGKGLDFIRDPDRLLRPGQVIGVNLLEWPTSLILKSKPRDNGGSLYFYYNKHTRDSRW